MGKAQVFQGIPWSFDQNGSKLTGVLSNQKHKTMQPI